MTHSNSISTLIACFWWFTTFETSTSQKCIVRMFWEMRWREFSGGYFVEKVWNTEAILDDTCRKSLWALPKKAKNSSAADGP